MRENVIIFDPERKLFLYLGLIFIAVVLGPFGTYDSLTLWSRTTFWALDILGAAIIMSVTLHVFFHSRITERIPQLGRLFLAILIGAVPASAYVALICDTIGASLHLNLPFPVVYLQIVVLAVFVFPVEFIVWPKIFRHSSGKTHLADEGALTKVVPIEVPPMPSQPRLIQRLPHAVQGDIISISMQDHYANVSTTLGEHLLLIRFSDAIDLLDGQPGVQIHRSHWVSKHGAQGLSRDGRRHELTTTDGRSLPVSSARLPDVKAMLGPLS